MSQNCCCVPGCLVRKNEGIPLHRFPNPDVDSERFNVWISKICCEVATIDVYGNRRVCHKHFEDIHKYPRNRLSKLAIPMLYLPEKTPIAAQLSQRGPSSIQDIQPNIQITEHPLPTFVALPSTSRMLDAQITGEPHKQNGHTQHKRKSSKPRGPFVPIKKHKEYKSLLKQLEKCDRARVAFKKKYNLAKKMTRATAFKFASSKMSHRAKILFQMQVTQSGKKKHGRRFTLDEKILALSLYKPSPKAYRLLRTMCVLSSRRTLQNLLHKVNLKAGVNNIIFENLKKRVAKLPDDYKYCCLLFDEMAIGPAINYDKRNDKLLGFVNNGEKIENEFCDHVLVFMIRGIVKKFKQPIAYYYCSGSTKAIELKAQIKKKILKIQESGLTVVATTCDQGSSNVAAINSLLRETREAYLRNGIEYREGFFMVGKEKIFPLYDPPHLIKGIRNNLITKNLKFTMNGKECTAKWSHLVALYNRCPAYKGVKMVHNLTALHILPNLIPKMRVKHCTQVFSQSVAVGLGSLANIGILEKDSPDTAELLSFFDNLFDSVNGSFSEIREGKKYRAAVTPTSPHHKLWNYSIPILKTMKYVKSVVAFYKRKSRT